MFDDRLGAASDNQRCKFCMCARKLRCCRQRFRGSSRQGSLSDLPYVHRWRPAESASRQSAGGMLGHDIDLGRVLSQCPRHRGAKPMLRTIIE